MERCSAKGLEEMKGAEAVAAEEEMRKEEAVAEEEMRAQTSLLRTSVFRKGRSSSFWPMV
jgi:hypothetical protein